MMQVPDLVFNDFDGDGIKDLEDSDDTTTGLKIQRI